MNPDAARHLTDHINAIHAAGCSYRHMAAEHFPGVAPGTLNRIAKSGGAWMPKDRRILRALGLIETKTLTPHERRVRRKVAGMAKETRKQVLKK